MVKRTEQAFMHLATYRLDDLRNAGLLAAAEIPPALADDLSARLAAVCEQQGWEIINIATHPDRLEALLAGTEPAGETGEAVATALDEAVYGAGAPSAAAMN